MSETLAYYVGMKRLMLYNYFAIFEIIEEKMVQIEGIEKIEANILNYEFFNIYSINEQFYSGAERENDE